MSTVVMRTVRAGGGRDDLRFFVAIKTLVGSIVESSILFDVDVTTGGGGHLDVDIIVGYVGG